MCCEAYLAKALRSRGLRMTPQRQLILQALHQVETDASAEEVYTRVKSQSSVIDLSTVYRTLDLYTELKLVSAFNLANGDRHYELLTVHKPHFHLLCTQCGELSSVPLQELKPLSEQLALQYRFDPDLAHLVIPGICEKCQAVQQPANTLTSLPAAS